MVVAAPVKEPDVLNVVVGVNHHLYDPAKYSIVTAASCTTNCLAPVVKVIHEAPRHPSRPDHHDPRSDQHQRGDGRSAQGPAAGPAPPCCHCSRRRRAAPRRSPSSIRNSRGKLDGHAVRAPVLNASLTDCVFELSRSTTREEVNALFAKAAKGSLAGILGYEPRPLVSIDYARDTRSSIIDGLSTLVTDGTLLKVYAWYDNEMGYACRMVDLACILHEAGI